MKPVHLCPSVKSVSSVVKVLHGTGLTTDDADDTDKEDAALPIREIRAIRGQKTLWGRRGESQGIRLGVALTVFITDAAAFQGRDIKL